MVAAHVAQRQPLAAAAMMSGMIAPVLMLGAMLPMAVPLVVAAVPGIAAVMAVGGEMVAMAAPDVVAPMIVPAVPSVAAPIGRGVADRFVITGIAVTQPPRISRAHAALVKLDAIVVASAPARPVGAGRIVAVVGGGIAVIVIVEPAPIGVGGADKDEAGKGGEDQRLLHLTLPENAESRSFTIVNDCC